MAQKRKSLLYAEECKPLTQTQVDNIKAQFRPLNTANVLIIDPAARPNTWTENTEIDLGGGLYGYRATGNMPEISANTGAKVFEKSYSGQIKIYSFGGSFTTFNYSNQINTSNIGRRFGINNEIVSDACIFYSANAILQFNVIMGELFHTTSSNTYDIWFTYTK